MQSYCWEEIDVGLSWNLQGCVCLRLSQSRSLGFLVWCGRTQHDPAFARSRFALKSSTCEQVYVCLFIMEEKVMDSVEFSDFN